VRHSKFDRLRTASVITRIAGNRLYVSFGQLRT